MTDLAEKVATLEQMRAAGLPIKNGRRDYQSKRMTGFNQEVYSAWIERWANNAAKNYPIISDSWGIRFLFQSAKNIPAIIVGIGPSLDKNYDQLKQAAEHMLIIATDAALRPLLRHGIKPDLVVNYDARHEQQTLWESVGSMTKDLILVANSVTSPYTVNAWKGKILFFNPQQADDEFATNILPAMYPHLGGLPNLGTVGNGAIYLANEMGCDPILTVGMDLCYRPNAEPNDAIAEDGIKWHYRCQDFLSDPNNAEFPEGWKPTENKILYDNDLRTKNAFRKEHKGKEFMVDEALVYYANSLIRNIGELDLPVIDCSDGVLAQYIRHLSIEDVIEEKKMEVIAPGRTVVRHLNKIIEDGKKGRTFDSLSGTSWIEK